MEKPLRKFPNLEYLDRGDIKFSCLPQDVILAMAKILGPADTHGWRRIASYLGYDYHDINHLHSLTKYSGCSCQNMFERYASEKNSLKLFTDALIHYTFEDVLQILNDNWNEIMKFHSRPPSREAVQNSTRSYNNSNHNVPTHLTPHHEPCTSCPSHQSPPFENCRCVSKQPCCCNTTPKQDDCCCQKLSNRSNPPYISTSTEDTQYSLMKHRRTLQWLEHVTPEGSPRGTNTSNGLKQEHCDEKHQATVANNVSSSPSDIEMLDLSKKREEHVKNELKNVHSSLENGAMECGGVPNKMAKLSHDQSIGAEVSKSPVAMDTERAANVESSFYLKKGIPIGDQPNKLPPFAGFVPNQAPGVPHTQNNRINGVYREPVHGLAHNAAPGNGCFNPLAPVPYGHVQDNMEEEPCPRAAPTLGVRGHGVNRVIQPAPPSEQSLSQTEQNQQYQVPMPPQQLGLMRHNTVPLSRSDQIRLRMSPTLSDGQVHNKWKSANPSLESGEFFNGYRNVSIFVTHIYNSGEYNNSPDEAKRYDKCALSLGKCLKENMFGVQMDVPNANRVPESEPSWREWIDKNFATADYVLVCITPLYLSVINDVSIHDLDEEMITNNILSTRYIFHLMEHEFENNNARNARFLPILFSDIQTRYLPGFLQRVQTYKWTRDFENLFWRLSRPEQDLSRYLRNQQRP